MQFNKEKKRQKKKKRNWKNIAAIWQRVATQLLCGRATLVLYARTKDQLKQRARIVMKQK